MNSDEKTFETVVGEVRNILRIKSLSFDTEITECIKACLKDLSLIGISSEKLSDLSDPLIKSAIYNYCKAEFGLDNTDSAKYKEAYEQLKIKLSISTEYTKGKVKNVD